MHTDILISERATFVIDNLEQTKQAKHANSDLEKRKEMVQQFQPHSHFPDIHSIAIATIRNISGISLLIGIPSVPS